MKDNAFLLLDEMIEDSQQLSEFVFVGGAIGGLVSSKIAKGKNENIINNLKLAKEKCKTDACRNAIQAKIEKYIHKNRNSSGLARVIGGLLTSNVGVIIYHLIDKAKKKRDTKSLIKLLNLKDKLKECKKNEDKECIERITKQVYLIKNAYKGKVPKGGID